MGYQNKTRLFQRGNEVFVAKDISRDFFHKVELLGQQQKQVAAPAKPLMAQTAAVKPNVKGSTITTNENANPNTNPIPTRKHYI